MQIDRKVHASASLNKDHFYTLKPSFNRFYSVGAKYSLSEVQKMSSLSMRGHRVIILSHFKRGLSTKKWHRKLFDVFRNKYPFSSAIQRWYKGFQNSNYKLENDRYSGRPAELVTSGNTTAVRNVIKQNPHVTYMQTENLHTSLRNKLHLKKFCTHWMPHKLTEEQKQFRIKWCQNTLKKFQSGTSKLVNSIVTGDETWLYYYDAPTKSQSMAWAVKAEEAQKIAKHVQSARKKIIAVFFGKCGLIERVILNGQKNVTAIWYIENCLPRVIQSLKKLRPRSRMDSWFLHHDNAPPHRAHIAQQFLENSSLKLLGHPPYSPDLAPCDFGLFPHIKSQLRGRLFADEDELIAAWDEACAAVPEEKWAQIFDNWFRRMVKCIKCDGKYFKKL